MFFSVLIAKIVIWCFLKMMVGSWQLKKRRSQSGHYCYSGLLIIAQRVSRKCLANDPFLYDIYNMIYIYISVIMVVEFHSESHDIQYLKI